MNDPTDLDGRSVFLGRHGLNEDLALQQPRTYLGLLSLGERIDLQEPTRTRNLAPNPRLREIHILLESPRNSCFQFRSKRLRRDQDADQGKHNDENLAGIKS